MRRSVSFLVVLFAVVQLVAADTGSRYARDQVKKLMVTDLFRRYGAEAGDELVLAMALTDADGRLLKDSSVTLRYRDIEDRITPIRPGLFSIELDRGLRRKGAAVELKVSGHHGLVKMHISSQQEENGTPAGLPEVLTTEGFRYSGQEPGGAGSWFRRENSRELANEAAAFLEKAAPRAAEILGVDKQQKVTAVLVEGGGPVVSGEPGLLPYLYETQDFDEFKEAAVRSLCEKLLSSRLTLDADRRNRWIYEGLAGWATVRSLVSVGEDGAMAKRMDELVASLKPVLESNPPTYDLSKFSWPLARGFIYADSHEATGDPDPGTAVSLAFFLRFAGRYGEEKIERFIEEASSMRDGARTFHNLVGLLESISGEKLKLEIRSFSAMEAVAFLESAGG